MFFYLVIILYLCTELIKTPMEKHLPVNISQANAITESRYDFNRIEKNTLYCIIREVRKNYVEERVEYEGYQNMTVFIDEADLVDIAGKKHKEDAKAALVGLRHRDITIDNEDGGWFNCGFINYAHYIPGNNVYEVEVSKKIMPYLVDLASKYTTYSLTVAMTLKSKWAQRFYELCCQYLNHLEKGIPAFQKSVSQLRRMFMLEDKYPKLPDLKKFVIDKAQKELKESYDKGNSDLWFEYNQTGKGEEAEFKFIIHTYEQTQAQKKQFKELREMAYHIYTTLLSIFPKDTKFCEKCWRHLDFYPDKIEPLYGKLERILKNYPKGKDRAKVTRYMLAEDFQMTSKMKK